MSYKKVIFKTVKLCWVLLDKLTYLVKDFGSVGKLTLTAQKVLVSEMVSGR